MSSGLDPVILQKLEAFSLRRRKLIILRGVFAAAAMLLSTMMLVALMDYLFVLPDSVRWTLSGLAYLAVIITEWRACLRLLVRAPDARVLARLIEHAEPKLREDLISAVELGQSSASFDSEQFRQLVQADVATRIEGLNMDKLLPVQLLRRTIVLAGLVVVGCIVVFAASGLQFGTLLMRAMLPMANLARVSKVKVHIVEPAPAEGVVPQGDSVPLVIEISGQRTNKAVLETFTKNGGREVAPMTPTGPDRFVANIQVARDDIEYRIRAGDALTRKYQLQAKPRPHVVRFHKTYHYPEYVKLPEKQLAEENGDLIALEGTHVTVMLEADQPVKSAELRMEQGKQSSSIPLQSAADGKLFAAFPLKEAGYYRVHLVAAQTGFENKFSPEYELRPEPDLAPQIALELPSADLILPSNEVVDLRGKATDDFGIAKVAQMIRVNEGEWKEIPLTHSPGKEVTIEKRWDLYEEGVKAGDLLTTKLLAVDVKGSRVESRPIRITVTSSGFESNRLTSLGAQRQFLAALKTLRAAAETLERRAGESRAQIDSLAENDPQRKQALVSFTAALDDFERAAGGAVTQLHATLRAVTPGHATGEYVMLGRLLSRMWAGAEQNARDSVALASANETLPTVRDLIREAADACGRVAQRARMAEESGRVFVTSAAIDVLNESWHVAAREQERIAELAQGTGEDAPKWTQLVARLHVVLSQTKSLGEMINATAEDAKEGVGERLRKLQREIDKQRSVVEAALEKGGRKEELLAPLQKFTKATSDFRRSAFDIKRNYMHPPARAFDTMLREVQPTWTNFEKARQEVENFSRNDRLIPPQKAALMNARWDAKTALFKAHGDTEESRLDSDAYFVSDVRATTLVLNALRGPLLGGDKPFTEQEKSTAFGAVDKAFRLLESAHNLAEVVEGFSRLATAERWEASALRARTANPRDWEWLEARMKLLPDELGRTQLTDVRLREALKAAQTVLREAQRDPAWRSVNEQMKERMRPEVTPRAVPQEIENLAAFVKQALDLLREPVQDARALITQMAPKLNEVMNQLAKKAEQLRQETAQQAAKTAEKSPDQIQSDARRQLAQQQDLNREVEALKDALRSDANKQNLVEQEGRERARDADDALAMLKEPPPKAEDALAEAAAKTEGADQQPLLESAAAEQQKLADALNKLSEHYAALDQGKAQETRMALREEEKALGLKEAMEQRYARAEELSQMAQSSPEEMLKQLEKALPQNPLMQQELSGIARDTLKAASEKLADASQREKAVAEQVQRLAAEQQAKALAEALAQQQAQAQALAQAQQQAQAQGQQMPLGQPNAAQSPTGQNQSPAPQNTPAPSPGMTANQQNQPDSQQANQAPLQTAQTPNGNQPNSQAMANSPAQQNATPASPQPGSQNPAQPTPPNPQLAQAASQQAPIAKAANEAGMDVSRAGRHEQRLQNTATGRMLEQLGEEIRETGGKEVAEARQTLENTQMAAQAQTAVNAAQSELQNELSQLAAVQSGEAASPQPASPQGQQSAKAQQGAPGTQQPQMQAQSSKPGEPGSQNASPSAPHPQIPQQAQMAQANQQGAPANQQSPQHPQYEPGTPPWKQPNMFSGAKASPQEQVWMARALDVLDGALHADASQQQQGQAQQQQQQGQAQAGNQPSQGKPQGSQQNADAAAKAQQAMAQAAQAASAAMRASRSQESQNMQQPSSSVARGDQQAKSLTGALANGEAQKTGTLPGMQGSSRTGDWGKLPKKVAEQLTQGQRETVAGEYRNQVETYYRVIAERAKKP